MHDFFLGRLLVEEAQGRTILGLREWLASLPMQAAILGGQASTLNGHAASRSQGLRRATRRSLRFRAGHKNFEQTYQFRAFTGGSLCVESPHRQTPNQLCSSLV